MPVPDQLVSNIAKKLALTGLNLETDDIRVLLVTDGYSPDADHEFVADIVPASNELQDASYSRQALAGKAVTIDSTNDRAVFTASSIPFGAIVGGETIAGAVFFRWQTSDADSEFLWFQKISPPKTANGGTVTLNVRPVGLLTVGETAPADPAIDEEAVDSQFGEVTLSAGEGDAVFDVEEPDTDYIVVGLAGNVDEVFRAIDKLTTQFTIVSSNDASTATVGWEIRRPPDVS